MLVALDDVQWLDPVLGGGNPRSLFGGFATSRSAFLQLS